MIYSYQHCASDLNLEVAGIELVRRILSGGSDGGEEAYLKGREFKMEVNGICKEIFSYAAYED